MKTQRRRCVEGKLHQRRWKWLQRSHSRKNVSSGVSSESDYQPLLGCSTGPSTGMCSRGYSHLSEQLRCLWICHMAMSPLQTGNVTEGLHRGHSQQRQSFGNSWNRTICVCWQRKLGQKEQDACPDRALIRQLINDKCYVFETHQYAVHIMLRSDSAFSLLTYKRLVSTSIICLFTPTFFPPPCFKDIKLWN